MLKMTRRPVILCVEDEPILLRDLCEELEDAGYKAIGVPDVAAANLVLAQITPALILCDITLPGHSGLDFLEDLRARGDMPGVPFLLLTALADRESILRGKWAGADDYLIKPVDYDLLQATIAARLAQVSRMELAHRATLQQHSEAVSSQWRAVLDGIGQGALICGADLQVRFANRAAQALCKSLRNGPLTRTAEGKLALNADISEHPQLQRFVTGTTDDITVQVSLKSQQGKRWKVSVLALHERAVQAIGAEALQSDEMFVVFLADNIQSALPPREELVQRFYFTPTESQVAAMLAEGCTKQLMCERMSISASTMAYHLRNMFQKTQTKRQAELVALILSLGRTTSHNAAVAMA